ncbi:MAG: DUF1788 domain-containing protein [Pyramidobacter sp.]
MAEQVLSRDYFKKRRSLSERFAEMDEKIKNPSFRNASGKANEVNYWVFDYPPEKEMEVRSHIKWLQNRNSKGLDDYKLVVYDLYDLIIEELKAKGFLEKTEKLEERGGIRRVVTAVQRTLRITDKDNYLVQYISDHTPENAVVLICGIGKCYPILEAPEVFNKVLYNMPQKFASTPVILFYPGTYTEQDLVVFNEVVEDSYYRAFRIAR